jgi:hypothetical protein
VTRTRALIAGVALVLACAACSDSPTEPADPPASGPPPAAAFTATVTPGKGSLAISYRFTNQTSADLVALNRIRYENGYPPDAVYVTGRGDDGRVEISKRAFAMPHTDKMDWAAFATVGGVIVPPGQSVAEDITVPLPLVRTFPYGNDLGDGEIQLPDPIKDVVFCLGVIPRQALRSPSSSATADDGKVETVHSSLITAAQHLFCSAPAKL